ncbi:hypothetical protein KBD20_01425 [Candidatus Saccharibacteria bacterium]|nr:hypothetical protein [Candidatus Saccharibacteria bacterium]
MNLAEGKKIILFRYHDRPESAREQIKILRHFNPTIPIYVLDGGYPPHFEKRRIIIEDVADHVWLYESSQSTRWKWLHTYQLVKDWFKEVGAQVDFDFLFSYEYDLLTVAPLLDIYPDISDNEVALGAVTAFTNEFEKKWWWGSPIAKRVFREFSYEKFQHYIEVNHGLARQKYVCQGPGTLVPKRFLYDWSKEPDVNFVHEEILLPAYAEVFGYKIIDHGMHPGIFAPPEQDKYFNCRAVTDVSIDDIISELKTKGGRRAFHPVKNAIKITDLSVGP